eukprot:TRINITY_DN42200_c0_g1_i1.p1 TRINITY_DN42200_c0_g1~~TRINITY_DN42200_c0_g1_i1.p1  ORF type:complete len:238 (-),score=55.90 TRINITY_DN42200_c0_g1_i1:10-636(-)
MGNDISRIYGAPQWRYFEEFHKKTHFSVEELRTLHRSFLALARQSNEDKFRINRAQFEQALANASVKIDESERQAFMNHLFDEFDHDQSGWINFREYITGLSVFMRGTLHERLVMAFHIYDLDDNGVISPQEMTLVLTSLARPLQVANNDVFNALTPEARNDIEAWVAEVFKKFDKDNNKVLTKDEFIQAVLAQEDIISFGDRINRLV